MSQWPISWRRARGWAGETGRLSTWRARLGRTPNRITLANSDMNRLVHLHVQLEAQIDLKQSPLKHLMVYKCGIQLN